jgi:hypothetical protein
LFSRELPGQAASPALIAPAHGDDIQEIILALQREQGKIPTTPIDPSASRDLRTLIEQVRQKQIDRTTAIGQLRRIVPTLANLMLETGASAANQLLRLYDGDLLRPLALHAAATREILELDQAGRQRKQDWIRRLRRNNPAADLRLIERDAEVIVQTMLLNKAAVEDTPSIRYVLLTADNVLLDSYIRWYWEERQDDDDPDARFVLRTPLQYAPILNVQDMPNGIMRSDVIQRARDALDGLFINTPALRQGYPLKLAYYRILARNPTANRVVGDFYGYDPFKFDPLASKQFEAARHIWREGFRNGVVLNAELIRRRLEQEFELLARLLREDADLLTALHEEQRQIMGRLLSAHASLTTRINIRFVINAEGAPASVRRARLAISRRFAGILGDQPLNPALDRLIGGEHEISQQVESAIITAPPEEAYFFAACVAHRCGHWQAVRLYAQSALRALPAPVADDDDHLDLAYLRASAARYEFGSEQAILDGFSMLQNMIPVCRASANRFGLVRVLAEITSVILVSLYRSRILEEQLASTVIDRLAGYLTRLGPWLCEAQVQVLLLEGDHYDLQFHVAANIISWQVWVRFLQTPPHVTHAPEAAVIDWAIDVVDSLTKQETLPAVVLLELALARLATGKISRSDVLSWLQRPSAGLPEAGRRAHVALDNAEFQFFLDHLSKSGTTSAKSATVGYSG